MARKLIILVEILNNTGDEPQRVKREFETDLCPLPYCQLKLITGPPREIHYSLRESPIPVDPNQKIFTAIIEPKQISFFPEENTITVLIQDHTCLVIRKKVKVSEIISEYKKHGWQIQQS